MSWPLVTLGSLEGGKGNFVDGPFGSNLKSSEYTETGVPLIQLKNIKPNKYITKDLKFVSQEKADSISRHSYKAGDVCIAKLGAVGTACIIPEDAPDGIIVADVVRFRGDKALIDYKYFCHYLNSPVGQRNILKLSRGSTRTRTNLTDLKSVEIPLPPLAEQKRIAAILDKADSIRRKRKQAIQLADNFLRSVFLDMFGDPVTNPKGWEVKKFGEVGTLDRGKSKHRPRNDPKLLGGEYPLIQTGDVANSGGYITSYSSTYSELGLAQSRKWEEGTLCITIAANIAKTGILTFEACFPDSVVGFKPNEPVTTEFVQTWLGFLQKIIEANAPESAQKNINLAILRDLDIPLPPLEQQIHFTQVVEKTNQLKKKFECSVTLKENGFNSLSQKAFAGEL
ncbi:restriction endonuclease subunit S [Shewanella basaltis]|uniref:restriction endonuclease subunit S n=1 Tax=Shewanella basaltis TaxID=472183 RepID=UPI003AB05B11